MDEGQAVGADGAAEEGTREPKWDSIAAQRDNCPTLSERIHCVLGKLTLPPCPLKCI